MTYSPGHTAGAQRVIDLLDTLEQDMSELRQLVIICGDVMDLPGRGPAADPDNTGRQATHGPSRPTEDTALDPGRALLREAVERGVTRVARSVALVRGTTAEIDRAFGTWEGELPAGLRGNHDGCTSGSAEHSRAA